METQRILDIIGKEAMGWLPNLSEDKQLEYKQECIEAYRTIADIQYASEENSSIAAYGESQAGKSYLIDAIFSSPDTPFKIRKNANTEYIFNKDINPSNDGGQNEATGLITRFTSRPYDYTAANGDKFLRLQLLSVADLIIVLTEAYRNHVNHDVDQKDDLLSKLDKQIDNIRLSHQKSNHLLTVYDVASIKRYIEKSSELKVNCESILKNSKLLPFLLMNVEHLQEEEVIGLVSYLWNQNEDFNKLFTDLLSTLKQLQYLRQVHVELDSIVKVQGSILGVERLDEMYYPIPHKAEYRATTQVMLAEGGQMISMPKSFLSAVAAEISICVNNFSGNEKYGFLEHIDLLDFPGARHNSDLLESKLGEEKNLALAFRRGKVSYLFNKYSKTRRISGLLFCQNNNDPKANLGASLNNWVVENVGETPQARQEFMKQSVVPPLFIISTWFNTNLALVSTRKGDDLEERWFKRFHTVLLDQVIKSDQKDNTQYWFNNWANGVPFQNIFMLRSFKWSTQIFSGYSEVEGRPEVELKPTPEYPTFMADLKESFINYEFVRKHFINPEKSWDDAATVNNDGTLPIIAALNQIAPNLVKARAQLFESLFNKSIAAFITYLHENHYKSGNPEEKAQAAEREGKRICREIDRLFRLDHTSFASMLSMLMIEETTLYNAVFKLLQENQNVAPQADEYTQIYIDAGLSPECSREENISRLCRYLGVRTEAECIEELSLDIPDFSIDVLLSKKQMLTGGAEQLVTAIEKLWFNYLSYQFDKLKETFRWSAELRKNLLEIYQHVSPCHAILTRETDHYMRILRPEVLAGIIADHLAMSLNDFINTCGYYTISEEQKQRVNERNAKLNFGLDLDVLNYKQVASGVALLEQLNQANIILTRVGEASSGPRMELMPLPQYRNRWQWEQQLLAMMLLHCELKDEDLLSADQIAANNRLKEIMDKLTALLPKKDGNS